MGCGGAYNGMKQCSLIMHACNLFVLQPQRKHFTNPSGHYEVQDKIYSTIAQVYSSNYFISIAEFEVMVEPGDKYIAGFS